MIGDFSIFFDACRAMLSGASPYSVPGFYNPSWALLPFLPLTLLPYALARELYALLTCAGFITALWRFHIKPLYILIISLCSALLWVNIMQANVDWLVLLGATLPPPIGIWFVMIKPQVGVGVVLFWLLSRPTRRPIVFVPVALALVLNYAILGLPSFATGASMDVFPIGLPVAAWLLIESVRHADINKAAPGGAFAAPYYGITSWLMIAPLTRSRRALIIVTAASWLLVVLWGRV